MFIFLLKHPELFLILYHIQPKIKQYFPNCTLTLQLVNDPEIPESKQLFILIQTKLDIDTAFELLKQFDQNYWLDIYFQLGSIINLTLDFI